MVVYVGLISQRAEDVASKAVKIQLIIVFDYPTVV